MEGATDLKSWLKQNEIGQLHAQLCDNGFDRVEELEEVTEYDIKELAATIGISVGVKSKLIRAIKKLPNAVLSKERPRHVAVSAEEIEALNKLLVLKNDASTLQASLKNQLAFAQSRAKKNASEIKQARYAFMSAVKERFDNLEKQNEQLLSQKTTKIQNDQQRLLDLVGKVKETEEKSTTLIEQSSGRSTRERRAELVKMVDFTVANARGVMKMGKTSTFAFESDQKHELIQDITDFGSVSNTDGRLVPNAQRKYQKKNIYLEKKEQKDDVVVSANSGEIARNLAEIHRLVDRYTRQKWQCAEVMKKELYLNNLFALYALAKGGTKYELKYSMRVPNHGINGSVEMSYYTWKKVDSNTLAMSSKCTLKKGPNFQFSELFRNYPSEYMIKKTSTELDGLLKSLMEELGASTTPQEVLDSTREDILDIAGELNGRGKDVPGLKGYIDALVAICDL